MPSLSAVLIVKNEADRIGPCLESLQWADEIVILDSGSTDATTDIAARLGARVFTAQDWKGFGVQRQRAQARATSDWVLMVDADEQVTPRLRAEIQAALAADEQGKVYALPRLSFFFGRYMRHGGWYPDHVVRLYPRLKAGYGDELVHESLRYDGLTRVNLTHPLLHDTYRDLRHYVEKSGTYATAWAEDRAAQGRKAGILQGMLHGLSAFVGMYFLRAGFLDGRQGLLLALLSGHSTFLKYAALWTRGAKKRTGL